jgi:ubiquinone/menaquinone biosynthesis C-methylase UbiE
LRENKVKNKMENNILNRIKEESLLMTDLAKTRYKNNLGFHPIIRDNLRAEIYYNVVQGILDNLGLNPLSSKDQILDVGCGDGTLMKYLTNKGLDIKGVEIFSRKEHKGLDIKICDAHNMPFDDETFNITLSTAIYDPEMYNQDNDKLVKEIMRVTRAPGLYLINDGNQPNIPRIPGAYVLADSIPITETARLSIVGKL